MNTEKYWLCWSSRQNAFHIESEGDGEQTNREAFLEDRPSEFVPIGHFHTSEAAHAEADRLTPILRERDKKEGFSPPPA